MKTLTTSTTSKTARSVAARRVAGALPRPVVAAIDQSKILGIKAGARSGHRFIGVWVVVVDGRVFVRSWTIKPDGWYRAFLEDPLGAIQVGERQVRVRAVPAKGTRIRDAVERAYALKYSTPASRKYVRGFRTARRRDTTMEFVRR
jgi:hypothetical protein